MYFKFQLFSSPFQTLRPQLLFLPRQTITPPPPTFSKPLQIEKPPANERALPACACLHSQALFFPVTEVNCVHCGLRRLRKVQLTGLANGLGVEAERRGGIGDGAEISGLSIWIQGLTTGNF